MRPRRAPVAGLAGRPRWPQGLRRRAWLCCLLFASAGAAADDRFCDVADPAYRRLGDGEIEVVMRPVEGSRAKEACAVGLLAAPVESIFRVLEAAEHHHEFMPHLKVSEVERLGDGEFLNHQVLDLPFPLRNRHYTVRLVASTPEDRARGSTSSAETEEGGAIWSLTWTLAEAGNLETNEGGWTLLPVGEGRTLVAYRVHSDPGGVVPKWALNTATRRTLPSLLEALAERVRETAAGEPVAAAGAGDTP